MSESSMAGGKGTVAKETERCVLCGCLTDVPFSRPVWERATYVPGAGQLCLSCCRSVYHADDLRFLTEPMAI